jgi:hypothetical protein
MPSKEYSQLVIAPPPFEDTEKLTVALDPLHEVEFDTPVGTPIKVNPEVSVLARVLGFVKTILEAPAERPGVIQLTEVDEINTTEVQLVPPTVTVAPDTKSVPVKVIEVPPTVDPKVGLTLTNVGGTAYVNEDDKVDEVPLLETTTSLAPAVPAGVVQRI